MAKVAGAVLAPTVTIISTLLALGVITPFERGKAEALADSQASTLQAGTARIRIDVRQRSGTEGEGDYTGVGAYDFREGRGRFVYNFTNLPSLQPHAAAVEARYFQNAVFVHRPAQRRPDRWLLMNLDRDPEFEAKNLGGAATSSDETKVAEASVQDPTRVLARMADTGAVRDRGKTRSLGAELHEYSGMLPAASGDGEVTATAWIDDKDLIRRLDLTLAGGTSTTSMIFYDFGVDVDVEPPPPDQVAVHGKELRERLAELRRQERAR